MGKMHYTHLHGLHVAGGAVWCCCFSVVWLFLRRPARSYSAAITELLIVAIELVLSLSVLLEWLFSR